MAVTYKHSKANEIAIISSPYTKNKRVLYGDDWRAKDWKKIIDFWANHPTFKISVE